MARRTRWATYKLEPLVRPFAISIGVINVSLLFSGEDVLASKAALYQIPVFPFSSSSLEKELLVGERILASELTERRALRAREQDLASLFVFEAECELLGRGVKVRHHAIDGYVKC